MSNLCGELRHQTETFHHSVSTFDSFMQRPDNMRHLQSISFFQGQSERNVLTLIAVTCIFISAKYHEQTYPGISQLLDYIQSPFTYEQFAFMEIEILNTLNWRLQFISTYDILTHFFCQGILFTNDRIKSVYDKKAVPIDPKQFTYHAETVKHNADVFTEKCLKKHEFLQYDRLSLACGIIMSARKAQNLAEYWPAELVAMTGNRLNHPQVKHIMRHICEHFSDQISCSITNSAASSPVKN